MNEYQSDLARHLARIADRLRDVSALGLRFTKNSYDRDHFRAVQDASLELLALATGQTALDLEPIREAVLSRPTPFVGADAAVIDGAGVLVGTVTANRVVAAMCRPAAAAGGRLYCH